MSKSLCMEDTEQDRQAWIEAQVAASPERSQVARDRTARKLQFVQQQLAQSSASSTH